MKKNLLVLIVCTGMLHACTKMDHTYKPYLEDGERVYPGMPAGIQVNAGKNRAQIQFAKSEDPNVERYMIYWNDGADSLSVPQSKDSDTIRTTISNLKEQTYNFEIISIDKEKNQSLRVLKSAKVFGDLYESSLFNRSVVKATVEEGNKVRIEFAPADNGNISTEITYTNVEGKEVKLSIPSQENIANITDWKLGGKVMYRSQFKPYATAIDVFNVKEQQKMLVQRDVTAAYLKNYKQPFLSIQTDSRFRDPKDWIVNTTVQNHDGKGGWGSDNGTVLNMESGWGTPNIIDGKLYQTLLLPKGNYGVEIDLGSNGLNSSQVKIVAVPGNTLPNFTSDFQVPGALGAGNLSNKKMEFTMVADGIVSIGFLANMVGDQYWRVLKVSLLQYY